MQDLSAVNILAHPENDPEDSDSLGGRRLFHSFMRRFFENGSGDLFS